MCGLCCSGDAGRVAPRPAVHLISFRGLRRCEAVDRVRRNAGALAVSLQLRQHVAPAQPVWKIAGKLGMTWRLAAATPVMTGRPVTP